VVGMNELLLRFRSDAIISPHLWRINKINMLTYYKISLMNGPFCKGLVDLYINRLNRVDYKTIL
jgi:hypothetical protein